MSVEKQKKIHLVSPVFALGLDSSPSLSFFFFFAVLGTIRSAVGSAQLLMSQKFEQFRGLCNENLVSGFIFPAVCANYRC